MTKKILGVIFDIALGFVFIFFMLEFTLRLFPQLIPPALLIHFQKGLRQQIASQLGFTTEADTIPLQRDDGGPPFPFLYAFKEGVVVEKFPDNDDRLFVTVVKHQMDDLGFCNPSAKARSDIIVLGDSFAWCFNTLPENAWPAKLSELSGYSVYSLGVPGLGPYEYLQILKQFGLTKHPQIVVMSVYEGNDFQQAFEFHQYRSRLRAAEGREELVYPCAWLPRPLCFAYRLAREGRIGRTSYAFNLVANAPRQGMVEIYGLGRHEAESDMYALVLSDRTIRVNPPRLSESSWSAVWTLRSGGTSLEVFTEALRSFAELSRQYNFYPIVAYFPTLYTAYQDRIVFNDPEAEKLLRWFSDEQRKFFDEKSKELGYVFFDLTPTLQEASSQNREILYFPNSLHLTEAGNAGVAKELRRVLFENRILPLSSTAPYLPESRKQRP